MRRTGTVDGNRVFACLFVLAVHLALWWMLARKIDLPAPVGDAGGALQVTWIDPPKPAMASTPAAVPDDRRPAPAPTRHRQQHAATPDAAPAAAPVAHRPMSAIFLEQGRQLSGARDGDVALFAPDPLAHRRPKLPGPGDDRFRMRAPPSIRGALLRIGAMAGGPGYTTDPCPRVAGNIDELSQLGDSALLQEELRRKRDLCD
jgi:hypothetical protein